MKFKKFFAVLTAMCLLCAALPAFADGAFRYGIHGMTGDFNPFTLASGADGEVVDMTTLRLLKLDGNGQIAPDSPASVTVSQDGDMFRATISLREDICFADGTAADADDLIFALYVLLDSSYSGNASLRDLPIFGLTEYRIGMSQAEYDALAEQAESLYAAGYDAFNPSYWVDALNAGGEAYAESLTLHYCTKYPEVAGRLGGCMPAAGLYLLGYADMNKAGQLEALSGKKWTLAEGDVPGYSDLWSEMKAAFMQNDSDVNGLHVMSDYLSVGDGLFDFVNRAFVEFSVGGEESAFVSGILKGGEYTVDLLLTADPGEALYAALAQVPVVPVAHYGDAAMGEIGFPKGDLSGVWAKAAQPVGAGAYVLDSFENDVAVFTANENFYLGAPKANTVQFVGIADADALTKIVTGELDAVVLLLTEELEQMICSLNVDTKALTGNCVACYDMGEGRMLVTSSVRTAGFAESYASGSSWIGDAHLIEIR